MRIIEEYKDIDSKTIRIASANYIGDYAVRLKFSDGSEKLIDFKPFLSNSHHPSIRKYLEEKLFSKFQIIDGNLNWNDYDLIFPIWDLYKGEIEA